MQRTAGEIVAWYDLKAEKAKLPDNTKDGLTKVRALLEEQPAFTAAYNTAKEAYQAQATAAQAPTPVAPSQAVPNQDQYGYAPPAPPPGDQVAPLGYAAAAPPPPMYAPDYYYDWGPTWVEPAPWWWWQPVGFFGGFSFFPFSTGVVFDNDDSFFHHHHHSFHNHGFFHGGSFNHNGLTVAFNDSNHAFFHRNGQSAFFGTTARPNTSLAVSVRANFGSANRLAIGSGGARSSLNERMGSSAMHSTVAGMTMARASGFASSGTMMRQGSLSVSRGAPLFARSMPMRSGVMPRGSFGMMRPAGRFGGGMPRSTFGMPGFRGGMAGQGVRGPAFAAPHMSSPGAMGRSFNGGGLHGSSRGGGGFHGGGGHR